ncbi:MAG: PH domain-containing protein [Microbacteriaceae bacterium]
MTSEVRVPESVVARTRSHGRALFWPTVALLAVVGSASYFVGNFPELWQNVTALIAAIALIFVLWLLPLLNWLGRQYTITSRRIVVRRGVFVRVRQELLHSRGYDVLVRQNALQGMFGSGDVQINTGLERPVVLRDIPSADLVQEALHDLMESSLNPIAARRQLGQAEGSDETTRWGKR